jgi:hypothetical protein
MPLKKNWVTFQMARKLSRQRKHLLVELIISCELKRATEKEALAFIKRKMGKSISRRTYYRYKQALYNSQILKKTQSLFPNLSIGGKSRLFPERTYFNSEAKESHNYMDFIDIDFIPEGIYKVISEGYKTINNFRDSVNRRNKLKQTSRTNYELVPKKATIRKEYIKCSNYYCRRCKHGPYYYAYWRDQGKRYKKYLGKYDPRNNESIKLTDMTPFLIS